MNLKFLETFFWLARLKNFSQTAERLNTTQPAVSARLRALEAELGADLVFRTTREVHLTPAGEGLLRRVEIILDEMRQIREDLAQEISGIVRIGVVDAVVRSWLPLLFEWLRERHPRLSLEVTVDTTLQLSRGLRDGDLHLVVAIEPVAGDHLVAETLCRFAMGWVCRPGAIAQGKRYTPEDLAGLPLIAYPGHTPPARLIADYFHGVSYTGTRASASNSMATMIELAADGLGIAAVPPVCIAREISEGRLGVLDITRPFPPIRLIASFRGAPRQAAIDAAREGCHAAAGRFARQHPVMATID